MRKTGAPSDVFVVVVRCCLCRGYSWILYMYPGGASSTLRLPGTLCNLVPYFTQVQYVCYYFIIYFKNSNFCNKDIASRNHSTTHIKHRTSHKCKGAAKLREISPYAKLRLCSHTKLRLLPSTSQLTKNKFFANMRFVTSIDGSKPLPPYLRSSGPMICCQHQQIDCIICTLLSVKNFRDTAPNRTAKRTERSKQAFVFHSPATRKNSIAQQR